MRSVTAGPIMCAPTSAPVSVCHSTFTKPVVSPAAIALPSGRHGNLPTRTGMPRSLALASVRPTDATSGWQ